VININLGCISHRFRDMASFLLNFLPCPQFDNVPLEQNGLNFACRVSHTWLIICVRTFLYDLPVSQGTSVTDVRTDDGRQPCQLLDRYSLSTVG